MSHKKTQGLRDYEILAFSPFFLRTDFDNIEKTHNIEYDLTGIRIRALGSFKRS